MIEINKQNFKQDFNNNVLTNEQMFKKYGFTNSRDLCNYAKDNNLIDEPKPKTEEEEKNLSLMANQLKECMELLK